MARQGRSSTGGGRPVGADARTRTGKEPLKAAPRIDDIVGVAERHVRRLGELTGFDDVAGAAHRVCSKLLGEPVASQLLRLSIIIRGHHRIGLCREDKCAGCIGGEPVDPNPVVVDKATS
jgi:hypothetical protein